MNFLQDHRNGVSWRRTVAKIFAAPKVDDSFSRPYLGERIGGGEHQQIEANFGNFNSTWFGGQKWPGGLSSSGRGMMLDHRTIRRNMRTAIMHTPQARAMVDRSVDTIIDTGITLVPQPVASILGISDEAARDWGDDTGQRFYLWAKDKKCSLSEQEDFFQSQRMAGLSQQRDNDYFVRLYYQKRRDLQNPLQIQFIDPDQIGGASWTTTYGIQVNDDGIERDDAGREIAYKVQILKRDGQYKNVTVPAVGARSGRTMMLHGFRAEYPGQGRGFSRYGHLIQEFENLTDFTSAQIKKAINQSNFAMKVVPSKGSGASNPLENLVNTYAGPAVDAYGATPSEPTAIPLSELVQYIPLPEATNRVPGSVGLFNLQAGEDFEPIGSTAPSDDYDRFVDSFTSHLSASVGMPIEVLLMKFGENYSASRATLVLFWRIAQIWRNELDTDFNNPIYQMWLAGEIAARRISAPGWSDPIMRAAWLNAKWEGSPMPEIDPLKQSKANMNNAVIGSCDLDWAARMTNGSDGRVNRAKLTKQYSELPLVPWAIKRSDSLDAENGKGGDDAEDEEKPNKNKEGKRR
jgi:capsid protein